METKKKKEIPISNSGTILFDGTLTLKIKGKTYKVRCEYHGLDLQRASQEHQIVVLIKQHLPYDELDTGWLVRSKSYDEKHIFGLKAKKSDRSWSVYKYTDVVAWGYADGGLNSDHFDSCRLRPEDYPQFAGKQNDEDVVEEEWNDDDDIKRRGVAFRFDGKEIRYHAVVGADEKMSENATDLMRDAGKDFCEFRKQHPEVTEMHFYTDDDVAIE